PARFDTGIAAINPSQLFETSHEGCEVQFPELICRGAHEDGNPPRFARLLRPGREWPRCRVPEQRDELASADHSITSSARASRIGGTSRLSAFAVLRLTINSILAACCTGRSAAFSPFRIRPT